MPLGSSNEPIDSLDLPQPDLRPMKTAVIFAGLLVLGQASLEEDVAWLRSEIQAQKQILREQEQLLFYFVLILGKRSLTVVKASRDYKDI